MMSYSIDAASVERAFPPGKSTPLLLTEFMRWLQDRTWGSVGCFRVEGRFADAAPIYDGAPLRADFALFLYLPDGSQVGLWRAGRPSLDGAPVALLDSEGQHRTLAGSLEAFLSKLALRQFEDSDLDVHEDNEDDAADELASWLDERLGGADLFALATAPTDAPDFAKAMRAWTAEREAYWGQRPELAEASRRLTRLRPEGRNAWDTTTFEVGIVGERYCARVLQGGRQPFAEAAEIEAPLRALRDAMGRERPQLGLWFFMRFHLAADGRISPSFDYEKRPEIDGAPADPADARADLKRAPRPERWIPLWAV
jgi:hypothetical protein